MFLFFIGVYHRINIISNNEKIQKYTLLINFIFFFDFYKLLWFIVPIIKY